MIYIVNLIVRMRQIARFEQDQPHIYIHAGINNYLDTLQNTVLRKAAVARYGNSPTKTGLTAFRVPSAVTKVETEHAERVLTASQCKSRINTTTLSLC